MRQASSRAGSVSSAASAKDRNNGSARTIVVAPPGDHAIEQTASASATGVPASMRRLRRGAQHRLPVDVAVKDERGAEADRQLEPRDITCVGG
jgi:hypothetical protein